MNVVIISGRLGSDPKISNFDDGGKAAQFNIAVTERAYKRRDGTEVPERTEWIRVETGNTGISGVIEKYLKKGSFVMIEGRLKNRDWEKEGVKHYVTAVVIENLDLCPRNGEHSNDVPAPEAEPQPSKKVTSNKAANTEKSNTTSTAEYQAPDDDLPF